MMNPSDLRQKDNPAVPVIRDFWYAEGSSSSRKQKTLLLVTK
jgi:hypothetical protein